MVKYLNFKFFFLLRVKKFPQGKKTHNIIQSQKYVYIHVSFSILHKKEEMATMDRDDKICLITVGVGYKKRFKVIHGKINLNWLYWG